MTELHRTILALAAQIVTAHVRHNEVAVDAIPHLIRSVYNTLLDVGRNLSRLPTQAAATPAHNHLSHSHGDTGGSIAHNVYVHPVYGQTVFDDRLICMEDGLSMKMLKRHLLTVHGLTPDEYRAKWSLGDDYPMVALSYAKLRSSLALQSGLGLKPEARAGKQRKSR